tara:strand:- start:12822 stop:13535 length:714 start_codon:yes stop_codon:yes gene_type:complete
MEINTTLTFNSHVLFDGIESHIEEFILDLDYCNATEVDNVVGHAMKDSISEIADDIGDLETTNRGQQSMLNDHDERLGTIENSLLDIRAEDADTLRGVAQDVIDGNGFIDADELSDQLGNYLEEDDLSWRVEDIIGDQDLLADYEIRELIDEKINDKVEDNGMEALRGDLAIAIDMLERQRREMEGLQAEIDHALDEAMVARRSVLALIDRQPLEILRNAYWSVRNSVTDFKLRRKG